MFEASTSAPAVTGVVFEMTSQWPGWAAGADSGNVAMPESMTANATSMLVKPRNTGIALAVMPPSRFQSLSDSMKGIGSEG